VGENQTFATIQEAINYAKTDDIIFIHPGDYFENITINKSIKIFGSGSDITSIYNYQSNFVIDLQSNFSILRGLSVIGYGTFSGLQIRGHYNKIYDCNFKWNVIGISLAEADYNLIQNCTSFENTGAGIYLAGAENNLFKRTDCNNTIYGSGFNLWAASNNVFEDGVCSGNKKDGFYAYWLSYNNIIKNCSFSRNQGNGIYILDSDGFIIDNCTSETNEVNGFSISSYGNKISNCVSMNNNFSGYYFNHLEDSLVEQCTSLSNLKRGFYLKYAIRNRFINNTVAMNSGCGIYLGTSCSENRMSNNAFLFNGGGINQSWDLGKKNKWDIEGLGNYWWDYKYFYWNSSSDKSVWNRSYHIKPNGRSADNYPLKNAPISLDILGEISKGIWNDSDLDQVYDLIDEFPNDPLEYIDTDNDGIGENSDAFPTDPAAALDSDGDRFPDTWNAGMTEVNSTTGLVLDDYPNDPLQWQKVESYSVPGWINNMIFIYSFIISIFGIIIFIMVLKNWKNINKMK
jgi:parallel beta-helix repeat protein